MPTKEGDTTETLPSKQESRMTVAGKDVLTSVLEKQLLTAREEGLQSLSLLNSSGNVLMDTLKTMMPPDGSQRIVGEYTATSMRKLTKSICDIVVTKAKVIHAMHDISRDVN